MADMNAYHGKPERGRLRKYNVRCGDRSGLLTCVYHKSNKSIKGGDGNTLQARLLVFQCKCGEYVECTEAAWMAVEPKPVDCGCGRGEPRIPKLKPAKRHKEPKKIGRKPLEVGMLRRSAGYSLREVTIARIEELAQLRNVNRSQIAESCLMIGLELEEEDIEPYM